MTENQAGGVADPTAPPPLDFPMRRTCPYDPPPEYAQLRERGGPARVRLPNGQVAWLITRYDDVRGLLSDPRISSNREHPNLPVTEPVTPQARRNIAAVGGVLVGLDPPEHGVRRRLMINEFTVRRVAEMRPYIQQVVDECIDTILAGPKPCDLVHSLALQVPSLVLCELLGVPFEDRGFFERSSTTQLRRGIPPEERAKVAGELRAYLDKLVTLKEENPTDDLLGRLIVLNREKGVYDHQQLVWLSMFLLIAGHETTANMIALGILGLLREPDKLDRITGDAKTLGTAVEELLRYFTVVDALPRVATADIELGGVTIKEGDGVLISFAAANRDDGTFANAAEFDLDRGARHHVAFGWGVHQCLGQSLAREELAVVFGTLFTRIPTLRLACAEDELPFKNDSNIYGLDRLPVTW